LGAALTGPETYTDIEMIVPDWLEVVRNFQAFMWLASPLSGMGPMLVYPKLAVAAWALRAILISTHKTLKASQNILPQK
ncbi:MAG TPA: hypothetical protein VI542_31280, partial [Candidatus Tectomicrobia bacterium]